MARRLAEKRAHSFSHDNYEDTAYGKDSIDVHLIGAKAEVAVAWYYGIPVDREQRLEGDEHDFEVLHRNDGGTLDVKATTYKPSWLLVRESKTESDFYLATRVPSRDSSRVELVGWASRDELLAGDYIRSPGGGSHMNYRLKGDDLQPVPPSPLVDRVPKQAPAMSWK